MNLLLGYVGLHHLSDLVFCDRQPARPLDIIDADQVPLTHIRYRAFPSRSRPPQKLVRTPDVVLRQTGQISELHQQRSAAIQWVLRVAVRELRRRQPVRGRHTRPIRLYVLSMAEVGPACLGIELAPLLVHACGAIPGFGVCVSDAR